MAHGRPDFQVGVDIEAQSLADLDINIVAQTLGELDVNIAASAVTLQVNIAASAITLNVNISSQTANLNVNIAASAITLNVNISSTTANLNVNLAASAATVSINITAQTVSVRSQGEFSAVAGQSVDLVVSGANVAFGAASTTTYTVTAGKTLYITSVCGAWWANAAANADLPQIADVVIMIGGAVKFIQGGNGGLMAILPKPLVVAAGTVITYGVDCRANHTINCYAFLGGYEL